MKSRQFSLGYLFLELFWVAAALGSFRAVATWPNVDGALNVILILASIICSGAAIGGVFGHMTAGVCIALVLAFLALLLPAVMVA